MKPRDLADRHVTDPAALAAAVEAAPPYAPPSEGAGAAPPADTWERPTPLDVVNVPPFPVAVLPEPLRRYVAELAEATQTPPDLAAMLSLAVVATALAKRALVEVRDGWREPLNLYTVTALPPAARKSAVLAEVSAPLVEHERREAERMAPVVEEQRSARRTVEKRLMRLEDKAAKAEDAAARAEADAERAEIARELAAMPVPVLPRLLVGDVTPEQLATLLHEQGGRIAAFSAEGELFAIVAGRYSDGAPNMETLLKAHAGDDLRIDRRGRAEYVHRPALTIGLAVQPDVIQSLTGKREFRGRGLLGRFLYSLPVSTVGRRNVYTPPPVSPTTRTAYRDAVAGLLAWEPDTDQEGRAREHRIRVAPSALSALLDFGAWLEPRLGDGGELAHIGDFGGKLAGAVARIAASLHAVDRAPCAPWDAPIGEITMRAAVEIGRYLLAHALAAFALMGEDAAVEDARRVLRFIQRRAAERVTVRDVHQWARASVPTVERVDRALGLLADHGYVRALPPPERSGAGRKPSPSYAVSPYAHNPQNPQNPTGAGG